MTIIETIGEPAVLEQLAEECGELTQAALKLSRIIRGENPTPVAWQDAQAAVLEEIADVFVSVDEWTRGQPNEMIAALNDIMSRKHERWQSRLRGSRDEQTATADTCEVCAVRV